MLCETDSPIFSQLTGDEKSSRQFMQDNVISHIAKSTLDALDEVFGE
jgi:hypothetical protein